MRIDDQTYHKLSTLTQQLEQNLVTGKIDAAHARLKIIRDTTRELINDNTICQQVLAPLPKNYGARTEIISNGYAISIAYSSREQLWGGVYDVFNDQFTWLIEEGKDNNKFDVYYTTDLMINHLTEKDKNRLKIGYVYEKYFMHRLVNMNTTLGCLKILESLNYLLQAGETNQQGLLFAMHNIDVEISETVWNYIT